MAHVDSAGRDEKLRDSGGCCASAVEDDAHLGEFFMNKLEGVGQARQRNDGGAVLVVMEDGNVAALLESALDLEAAGRRDILQIDASEAAGEKPHSVDDFVHVLAANTQGDRVHIAEGFEENALALHDGHARLRTDITEAEHCGTVGHNGDGIPAARELIALVNVLLDLEAGRGNAGSVGKAQGFGGVDRGAVDHFQLALPFIVQAQGFFRVIHVFYLLYIICSG